MHESGNEYIGYAASCKTHKQVRDLYMKLKLQHVAARHIICAYCLPGIETYYHQDYVDDGEFGAGRFLLQLLTPNHITRRAVFVVRYYSGNKLGQKRHDTMLQAAEDVLTKSTYNTILGVHQSTTLKTIKEIQSARGNKSALETARYPCEILN